MMAHVSGRWPKHTWKALARICDDYGESYFFGEFPNAAVVLQMGPGHRGASQVQKLLAQLTSPEAADIWKPALVARLVRRTLWHFARAGGPGAHPDSTPEERAAYFEWLDAGDQAEAKQDLPTVQRLCHELIERLPEELRHLKTPEELRAMGVG